MKTGRERIVLTPEHVLITFVPAGLGSRFMAVVADGTIILGLTILAGLLFRALLPEAIGTPAGATAAFLLMWGYHIYFEVRHEGRTPGKRMTGLQVVDGRGLPITLQQSFVRNVVRALDFLPFFYGAGAFASLIDRYHRRFGDIVADTMVIEDRRRGGDPRLLTAARRFNSLRTAKIQRLIRQRVGPEEREFLLALCLRADGLEEKARFDLMESVGGWYRKRLDIDDPHLSGENLVRDLTSILFEKAA